MNPGGVSGSNGRSPLDYEIDITHPKIPGDIAYGALTFYRDKNPNGLSPTLHEDDDSGPWLRLAVARDAYLGAKDGCPTKCDRCELRDDKLRLGTPVWYSFELRAETGFPIVDARFVCAQIKAPYYDDDGGSPLFALRIDRGRYVATVEHLYEVTDVDFIDGSEVSRYVKPYEGPGSCPDAVRALDHHVFGNSIKDFKELQVRALLATDLQGLPHHLEDEFRWCTGLVKLRQGIPLPNDIHRWSRFTIRVAPTCIKNEDGILQLLVTDPQTGHDQLIVEATGEFGHAGDPNPSVNTGPSPGTGLQYFKLGPYRDKLAIWGCKTAAIDVRNIKRGGWEEGARLRQAMNSRVT
jgi:Polysaccharide lyase